MLLSSSHALLLEVASGFRLSGYLSFLTLLPSLALPPPPLAPSPQSSCSPVMTTYKLVTLEVRMFGLSTKLEALGLSVSGREVEGGEDCSGPCWPLPVSLMIGV